MPFDIIHSVLLHFLYVHILHLLFDTNRKTQWQTLNIYIVISRNLHLAMDNYHQIHTTYKFIQNSFRLGLMSDTEASFLDLHLSISDGFVKTKIYEK